jgi:predicted Zn-dependent peptidase
MHVVVVENHTEPLADVAMWYSVGSADDPPNRPGLAHALEHMMFRGTHALSGTGLDRASTRFGGDSNAETDLDYTHYFQTVPVRAVPFALHVEADRMRGLLLDPHDWSLEREAVLTEIADDYWSDKDRIEEAIRSRAYERTPFAHDPGGTPSDVRRIRVSDLRRFYDAAYRPQNATLVVTGDVDPRSIFARARSLFGAIRRGPPLRQAAEAPVRARGFVVRLRAVNDDLVDVALELRGANAPDVAGEEVALDLLDPEHEVLRRLLVDEGPCDSYEVKQDADSAGVGLVHILCYPDADHTVESALPFVRRALRELPSRVASADIAYAVRRDLLETTYACDSLRSEADLFGETYGLDDVDPRTMDRATARVSRAAVIAVLRRWSVPVAVALAGGKPKADSEQPARRVRAERVATAPLDADIEPAWARSAPAVILPRRDDDLQAFALPNGLRVFFQPRSADGTVYLRGGNEDRPILEYPHRTSLRTAERHAIALDADSPERMHGSSRDLPVMLSLLAGMWRVHEPTPRRPSRASPPRPRAAWIAMTGDVDPSVVRADVVRAFGGWRRTPPRTAPSPSPTPHPAGRHTPAASFGGGGPSVRAWLIFPAPERASPDFATMTMLDAMLGGGGDLDALLAREVRTRRGLVYGIGTEYDADNGQLDLWYESTQAHFAAAHTAVREVLESVRAGGISTQERDLAYDRLAAQALRDESEPAGILDRLARAAIDHRAPEDPRAEAAHYAAVTRDDMRRLAAQELRFKNVVEFDQGRDR